MSTNQSTYQQNSQITQLINKLSMDIDHIVNENQQKVSQLLKDLERQKQYTDNMLQLNDIYEKLVKVLEVADSDKKAFSEVVLNSRIYEFITTQLEEAKASFEEMSQRLTNVKFTLFECSQDALYIEQNNINVSKEELDNYANRLKLCLETAKQQLEESRTNYQTIIDSTQEYLSSLESNHNEILSALEKISDQEYLTKVDDVEHTLEAIMGYSDRIYEIGQTIKSDYFKDQQVNFLFQQTLKHLDQFMENQGIELSQENEAVSLISQLIRSDN